MSANIQKKKNRWAMAYNQKTDKDPEPGGNTQNGLYLSI